MLKALLCTLCLGIAISCSDKRANTDVIEPISLNIGDVKVTNGVLLFSNQQEFENTVRLLTNKGSQSLNDWELNFKGFVSMRTVYDQITEQDMTKIGGSKSLQGFENYVMLLEANGEKQAVRVISSDAMATLFNKDGLVIIGDDAYKYKFDKVLKVSKPTESDMSSLATFDCKSLRSTVNEIALIRQVNGKIISVKNGRAEGVKDDYCLVQYNGNRRLVGESNVTRNIGGSIFNSVTCQAKHQRRLFGIWWGEAIPRIRLRITSLLSSINTGNNIVANPSEAYGLNTKGASLDIPECPCYGTILYTADGDTSDGYKECSESESAF